MIKLVNLSKIGLIKQLYASCLRLSHESRVKAGVPEIRPVHCIYNPSDNQSFRFNLMVPSVNTEDVYGGIATALKFFLRMCSEMGCASRVVVLDAVVNKNIVDDLKKYDLTEDTGDNSSKSQIVDLSIRDGKVLNVNENDVFMATSWWSAYITQNIVKEQNETLGTSHSMVYFIQDFEPGFYPWSSRYLLAESTYKSDISTIAVFNSSLLKDYFVCKGYNFKKTFYFEPVLNEKLAEYLRERGSDTKRENQILIYGRPGVDRNAMALIIEGLRIWAQSYDNSRNWKLISAGEKHGDIRISPELKLHSKGKMSISEYADTMLRSKIGISLMVSPHPSYPPLEMSAFGMDVITNAFANKDLSDFSPYITSLEVCTAENIADELTRLCINSEHVRTVDFSSEYMAADNQWTEVIDGVINTLES